MLNCYFLLLSTHLLFILLLLLATCVSNSPFRTQSITVISHSRLHRTEGKAHPGLGVRGISVWGCTAVECTVAPSHTTAEQEMESRLEAEAGSDCKGQA